MVTQDLLFLVRAIFTTWTLCHPAGGSCLKLNAGIDWGLTSPGDTASAAEKLDFASRASCTRDAASAFISAMTSEWAEPLMAIFTASSWRHEWKDLVRGHPALQHLFTSILQNSAKPGLLVLADSSSMWDEQEPSAVEMNDLESSLRIIFNKCLQWMDFGGLSVNRPSAQDYELLKGAIAEDTRLALKPDHPPYPGSPICREIKDLMPTGNDTSGPQWRVTRAKLCLDILRQGESEPTWSLMYMASALARLDLVNSSTCLMPSRQALGLKPLPEDI